ncbi:MAG: hypothetical protein JNL40_00730 [Cyclobacteriaceae bacterium]|nr:hypothetical protein [Cyclobacteriaceae bacterium]
MRYPLFVRRNWSVFPRIIRWWFRVVRGEHNRSVMVDKTRVSMTWHIRRDWPFTPFVVVVGSKYFLPAPECLLFDRAIIGSRRDGSG